MRCLWLVLHRQQAQLALSQFWDACVELARLDPDQVDAKSTASVSVPQFLCAFCHAALPSSAQPWAYALPFMCARATETLLTGQGREDDVLTGQARECCIDVHAWGNLHAFGNMHAFANVCGCACMGQL